jgi:hypothetical protein
MLSAKRSLCRVFRLCREFLGGSRQRDLFAECFIFAESFLGGSRQCLGQSTKEGISDSATICRPPPLSPPPVSLLLHSASLPSSLSTSLSVPLSLRAQSSLNLEHGRGGGTGAMPARQSRSAELEAEVAVNVEV